MNWASAALTAFAVVVLRLGVAVGPPPGDPPPANAPPQAKILTPADGAIYLADNAVAFTGRGTAAADRHMHGSS